MGSTEVNLRPIWGAGGHDCACSEIFLCQEEELYLREYISLGKQVKYSSEWKKINVSVYISFLSHVKTFHHIQRMAFGK